MNPTLALKVLKERFSMIRRDVYSVKVWDSAVGAYCHQHMTQDRDIAIQRAKDARLTLRLEGRPELVKIVHPAQWVLEGFLAVGNQLQTSPQLGAPR